MTEWQEIKLGEVSEITSSKRIFYSDYVSEGIPFWRSKEVIEKFNRKEISTDLFITPEKYSEIKNKFGVPQPNDILLTSVGTLGIPYLVEDNEHFYFKDGNLTWIRNIDEQRLSPRYLYKWLASQQGRDSLREITIGSTQEALTIVGLKSLNLLLPPLPEQKAIAAVLNSLDDKIDLLHRQNQTLEAMAESLFRQWFVEEAQEDWEVTTIGAVLDTVLGGTPSTTKPEFWNGTIPWINSGEVNKFRIVEASKYITELGLSKSNAKLLPIGTTVVAITGATLGQVSLLEIETSANQSVVGIIPNKRLPKEYVFLWIKSKIREIILNETGGAQPHINKNDINETEIIIPPTEFLLEKIKPFESWSSKITSNVFQIRTLEKLRDTLLPKLMSGEVRVEV